MDIFKQIVIGISITVIIAVAKYLHHRPVSLIKEYQKELKDFLKESQKQERELLIDHFANSLVENLSPINKKLISLESRFFNFENNDPRCDK